MTLDELNASYGRERVKLAPCRTCDGDVVDIRTGEVLNVVGATPNLTPLPNDEALPPDVFVGVDEHGYGCYMRMVNGQAVKLED